MLSLQVMRCKDSRWQRLMPSGETPGNDLSLPQPHEILSQVSGKNCFEAKFFGDLDPTNEDLAKANDTWHRITAVNGKEVLEEGRKTKGGVSLRGGMPV